MGFRFFPVTFKQLISGCRILFCVTLFAAVANGQSDESGYTDVAKKRLLIRITAQYLQTISQGQIDMDSAVSIP
jgi:hypothetical protein